MTELDETAVARGRNRREPGVAVETLEDVPDVVAHGLLAQEETCGDRVRRRAVGEHDEDLVLPMRQRAPVAALASRVPRNGEAEHADHAVAAPQTNGADLDAPALAVRPHDHHGVVALVGPREATGERTARDGWVHLELVDERLADAVARDPACCLVRPAHPAVR